MRSALVLASLVATSVLGCTPRAAQRSDEPPQPGAAAPAPGEPEIVQTGKHFNLSLPAAHDRYGVHAHCAGGDAPESVIGEPDQRNEMTVGKDRLLVYGFRFPGGTLIIRCRNDKVETSRILK
jgi:hypothetical protein